MMASKILYTPVKHSYLIFYSIIQGTINFLFFKEKGSKALSTIYAELNKFDTAPTYSLSRMLSLKFNKFFKEDTIEKIKSGTTLSKEDLEFLTPDLPQYKLWDEQIYFYWLDKLSENCIIQYDDIEGEVVYFKELPELNLNNLNEPSLNQNYPYSFLYVSEKNYSDFSYTCESPEEKKTLTEYNSPLEKLLEKVSIPSLIKHVQDSISYREKNELDTYIVLACKTAGKDQSGFFHFPALMTGIYRRNNEKWLYSLTSLDQFPDDKLLNKTKCIIIPGSNLNVYSDIDFLKKTKIFIRELVNKILFEKAYPQLKILGICFGLQIIIDSLGGKVIKDKIPHGKSEVISLIDKFWEFEFVKKSKVEKRPTMKITEAHGDIVTENAEEKYGIVLYGSSDKNKYEVMVDNQEKIFLVEGHPEYSPMFNSCRAAKFHLQFFQKKEPTDENIIKYLQEAENDEVLKGNNFDEWRALCYTFMKS